MDRRDLLSAINDFFSDSIVLPPGEFDKELLLPIIETAKVKSNNLKRRSTRRKKQQHDRLKENQQPQTQTQCKVLFIFLLYNQFLFVLFSSNKSSIR